MLRPADGVALAQVPVVSSSPACTAGSFTEAFAAITAARLAMTDRAGRGVTVQVGRYGRSVNEVAVGRGQLLDIVRDRNASAPAAWLAARPQALRDQTRWIHRRRTAEYSDRRR